ncbi:arginase family protein [Paenibacillus xylaniclasticus]|uniref:arginase family protein n=1 Tax=Paenibacillus xylaniclasticus TaxID=588083 RepID=UPI0013E0309A|nr:MULTISPECIES: arginase family protein [Paenibacillus]GFN33201.1 agmatinase [Paenibacillus curdlanolyticus]
MEVGVPTIIGVPYEEGAYWRKGMKDGPAHVIGQLKKLRTYSISAQKVLPWEWDEIVGDMLELSPYHKDESLCRIESAVRKVIDQGRVPFLLGGDHSITLPAVRAVSKAMKGKELSILHFDAHADTFAPVNGYAYHHGAVFRNIIEEKLVMPEHLNQFGMRGQVRDDSWTFYQEYESVRCVSMKEFRENQCQLSRFDIPKDRLYYISIDIDVVDPAFAPGTGTPVPGGLSSFEMLGLIEQLKEYSIVGLDVVEVAPSYDPTGITGLLAAQIVFDLLMNGTFVSIAKLENRKEMAN